MIDSNEYKDQENKESDTALVPSELHILVTDADTNGYEISKMSDFMGLYAQQLTRSLADSPFVEVVSNIPVADLGIINDVSVCIKDSVFIDQACGPEHFS